MKTLQYGFCVAAMACLLMIGALFTPSTANAGGPNPAVVFDTNMGRIILILYPSEAPITVKNFLKYVDDGFYDNTIFHRVVTPTDFKTQPGKKKELPFSMIQGGGFDTRMKQKRPTYPPIKNEARVGLSNKKGTISMARGADPNSATCQFFINTEDNFIFNYSLSKIQRKYETKEPEFRETHGYAAFGKVIRGMDIVEKINDVPTHRKGRHENIPKEPVIIKRAYRPQ